MKIQSNSMLQFKYESLIGGLNNLVEKGDSFIVFQRKASPDYIALWKAIEANKRSLLYSKPQVKGPELAAGEVFETLSWRIKHLG